MQLQDVTTIQRPPPSAQQYMKVVDGLLPGIKLLAAGEHLDVGHSLAMLCGHALECALKAYVAHATSAKTAKDQGHDIAKLWQLATESRFAECPMPDWVAKLHGLHSDYSVRYLDVDMGIVWPMTQPTVDQLIKLSERVKAIIVAP